ncbi:Serine/threonine-protein phosphatase 2A 56 kDa regulatory subunit delta isoform [Fasciolopsis buskii]|uniref:Serine/threonine-protein phosphatase 2A 56 kDa regulatory subunit delta isoform n=1 Tax=Fasciolopsis buskii TaxID=27845 RepID=A0A8E0S065_9TREM|nr:Serine/threonine-protein phosphatase 2A 56 kDa regulatory subunit delta isoform [Fasciolopsis buski]
MSTIRLSAFCVHKAVENIRQIPEITMPTSNIRSETKASLVPSKSLPSSGRTIEWLGKKTRAEEIKMKDIDRIASNSQRRRQVSSRFIGNEGDDLKALPLLVETPGNERETLFLEKVRMCCILFDFNEVTRQVKSKEIKRVTLVELAEYITMNQNCLTEPIYHGLVKLLQTNAFRVLDAPDQTNFEAALDEDDEDICLEPSWPHLQLVYETFLRFVSSPDFQPILGKKYINQDFLTQFVQLFDSEDPREREYVKTILHRIFGKLINLRSFIRRLIDYVFLKFIYEEDKHRGIGELLDIMDSIIHGFQVPLKDEHKTFLRRVLLPLHKARSYGVFTQQLTNCVTEFIRKDSCLLTPVLMEGVLRFWPKTNSNKEVLFLNELKACLECASSSEFQSVARPVFMQISRCIQSLHFQVSERALFLWNDEYILSLMAENIDLICPIVYPALSEAKTHWNKVIQGLVYNAVNWMVEIDQKLVERCSRNLEADSKKAAEDARRRKANWAKLEAAVKLGPSGSVQTVVQTYPTGVMVQSEFPRPTWSQPSPLVPPASSESGSQARGGFTTAEVCMSTTSVSSTKAPIRTWKSMEQTTPISVLTKVISSVNSTGDNKTTKSNPVGLAISESMPPSTNTDSVSIVKTFYSTPFKTVPVNSPRTAVAPASSSTTLPNTTAAPKPLVISPKSSADAILNTIMAGPNTNTVNQIRKTSLDKGKKTKMKSKDAEVKSNTAVRKSSRQSPEPNSSNVYQSQKRRSSRGGT